MLRDQPVAVAEVVEPSEATGTTSRPPIDPRPKKVPSTPREPARPTTRSRGGGGGFGIAIIIALMLFSRLPRMIQDFGDRKRDKPAPELREEDLRRIREVVNDVPAPLDEEFNGLVDPDDPLPDPEPPDDQPKNDPLDDEI